MDALSIWVGNDYAYFRHKGRGEEYRPNAERVRVNRVVKRIEPGNTRESTFVMVQFLDDDGTPKIRERYDSETYRYVRDSAPIEVKARDIAELWDHYVQERNDREAHSRAIEAAKQRELDERNAAQRKYLHDVSEMLGVESKFINVRWGSIEISKTEIDRLLAERNHAQALNDRQQAISQGLSVEEAPVIAVDSVNDETGEVEDVSDYMRDIISGKF